MRVVILQPGYLPWLGFFDQMNRCDLFVVYDDVQYTRRDWRNRNRIKSRNGLLWLTVPVVHQPQQLINQALIDYSQNWIRKHLGSIKACYARAPFFDRVFAGLRQILCQQYKLLLDLDMHLIMYLREWLEISTPIVYSSRLGVAGSKTERLVEICRKLGAKKYLTGDAAKNYLDEELFGCYGIEVEYHGYHHPVYNQLHGDFIPYCSALDLIMNYGDHSASVLRQN